MMGIKSESGVFSSSLRNIIRLLHLLLALGLLALSFVTLLVFQSISPLLVSLSVVLQYGWSQNVIKLCSDCPSLLLCFK